MTLRERNFILAGILGGLLVAVAVYGLSLFSIRIFGSSQATQMEPAANASRTEDAPSVAGTTIPPSTSAADTSQSPAAIELSDEEQHTIGLQTFVVHPRVVESAPLFTGRVEAPETGLVNISARVAGRIDKLHVDFTGQPVRRGQAIAEIYSPEVLTSAEEYKLALESRHRLGSQTDMQAVLGGDDLITASQRRLELWGLTPQQIATIASSDQPQIDITIYSPASGIVTERKVTQGQYVSTGDVLYSIADLSQVWVKVDLYEADTPQVHLGQTVEVTSESLPGMKLHGHVGFLDPTVNGQTRTTSARIQVANPGIRLRPGAFVQARLLAPSGSRILAVPRSAVVNSGTRNLVYVAKGGGAFEAHEVQLGPAGDDYFPVLAGIHDGDRVVSQGNFLLDSQTRIGGGLSGMFGGSKDFNQKASGTTQQALRISLRSDPATPRSGAEAAMHVSVQDAAGKGVTDAQVQATLFMPAMPAMGMAEMRETSSLTWNGSEYVGNVKVLTPGTWSVTVEVTRGSQRLGSYRTSLNAR